MEGIASVWSYQEIINDLKNKLLYTTYELESARIDAKEEMRKNEDYTKQLLQLLNAAYRERDEARDQLHRLLSKIMPNSTAEIFSIFTNPRSESSSLKTKGANSSFTESDSLSEAYNNQHSYGSSPVDSFIDQVSSPEMSNMNVGDSKILGKAQQPIIQESNLPIPIDNSSGNLSASIGSISLRVDHATSVIDKLIKGKPLPQKGTLLQAVMEAGPLLQTLLVAGPLPQWQNPPPLQPFQIPAVSIKGPDPENVHQKPIPLSNYVDQGSLPSSYLGILPQICSPSVLNFSCSPGSCIPTAINQDFSHRELRSGKRQRLE